MGGKRVCEVCGINESRRGGFFASFPLDESRCRTWVKLVGKEDLVYLPIEKLHKIRSICGDHFEKKDFNKKGSRLKKTAYPKLNLLAAPLTDEQMREFPLHVASKNVSAPVLAIPGTSKQKQITLVEHNLNVSAPVLAIPGTSKQKQITLVEHNLNVPVLAIPGTSKQKQTTLVEHNLNVHPSPKKRFGEPITVNVKRVKQSEICHETNQKDEKPDLNEREKLLLKKLKVAKASLRSVRRTVKDMEEIKYPVLKDLIAMAIKNRKRKPRGCRWTNKYKISCLAIYKRSPKVYRYLHHLLPLPSAKTLQNILKKIPMEPGINQQVLDYLSKVSKKKQRLDKYCCLLFDEIALKPKLHYNAATDQVEGYSDLGNSQRSSSLADHALVVMIQGLKQKFKQPLSFYLVKGTISSNSLASIIHENILAVNKTGFNVMATVCDQGPTNMGALKILKNLSPTEGNGESQNYFNVRDKKNYIIYDVPHLLKSIRNNFMNYGELQMDGKTAKWQYLTKVQELNKELLYLSKVTETHVQPKYRAKMKVKYASQLLSNTVASVLKLVALLEKDPTVSNAIMQTGLIIHELDRLFDKTNGPSGPADIKKGQRENVSAKTDHVREWTQFRKKLESLKFVKVGAGIRAKNVRCVQGYITTLCSLRDLWQELQNLGFKYFNLRQVNQDALENLFGVLRQHSPTNSHPTVSNFIGALKTAVISRLTAPHSRGSNCQMDGNNLMTDFHDLIFEGTSEAEKEIPKSHLNDSSQEKENLGLEEDAVFLNLPDLMDEEDESELLNLKSQPIVYVSGFIASHILKKNKCSLCKDLISVANPGDDPTYNYIKLREWWKDRTSLTYPTVDLCKVIEKCVKIFENEVIPVLYRTNICNLAVTLFMTNSDTSFLKCDEHFANVTKMIYSRLAILLIRRQCQRINQTLSIQVDDLADKTKKAQQKGVDK